MSTVNPGLQTTETPPKHRKRVWITILVVVLALVGAGAIVLALTGASSTANVKGAYGKVPAATADLIANPPNFDCVATVKAAKLPMKGDQVILEYIPNAVGDDAATERAFSDAVDVPALPATRDRILASTCSKPEYAGMIGVALATKVEVNGVSLATLNKDLLGQFTNTTPKAWADKVFSGKISYADATKTMTQLAGLMSIFKADKVETHTTTWNFHADKGVMTTEANVRPIVLNDKQYTGDFLVFSLTEKGQTGCFAEFGINVGVNGNVNLGDQRIAGFNCSQPKPHTPTTPSTSITPHTPGTPPPTTTTPVCEDQHTKPCAKNVANDIGSNPKVDDWKKDGGDQHTVSGADGSKVSNGYQSDPAADAAKAAADAAAKAAAEQAAHQAAVDAAAKAQQQAAAQAAAEQQAAADAAAKAQSDAEKQAAADAAAKAAADAAAAQAAQQEAQDQNHTQSTDPNGTDPNW